MLDELQEHVESIDMANGNVLSLLHYIKTVVGLMWTVSIMLNEEA